MDKFNMRNPAVKRIMQAGGIGLGWDGLGFVLAPLRALNSAPPHLPQEIKEIQEDSSGDLMAVALEVSGLVACGTMSTCPIELQLGVLVYNS